MVSLRMILYASSLALLSAGCFFYSKYQYDKGYAAATAEISQAIAAKERENAAKVQAASRDYQAAHAAAQQQERVQYVEIQKIVEKPVYMRDCFDDDGVRELNRAIGSR